MKLDTHQFAPFNLIIYYRLLRHAGSTQIHTQDIKKP